MASPLNQTVYIVEGEKDADRLAALGLVATCNAGGAGKWRKEHSECIKDRTAIVIADNDEAGRDHAKKVALSLRKVNQTQMVRILELPGLPEKGDVSDWLDAGGTVDELQKLKTSAPAKPKKGESDAGDEEEKRSQTDMIVQFAREQFDLLHDRNGDVFARDNRTGEVRRLGGRQFKDRLVAGFYHKTQIRRPRHPIRPTMRSRLNPHTRQLKEHGTTF